LKKEKKKVKRPKKSWGDLTSEQGKVCKKKSQTEGKKNRAKWGGILVVKTENEGWQSKRQKKNERRRS